MPRTRSRESDGRVRVVVHRNGAQQLTLDGRAEPAKTHRNEANREREAKDEREDSEMSQPRTVGVEIDYRPELPYPWLVNLVSESSDGTRERWPTGNRGRKTLRATKAFQGKLMDLHGVPGWATMRAAQQQDRERTKLEVAA